MLRGLPLRHMSPSSVSSDLNNAAQLLGYPPRVAEPPIPFSDIETNLDEARSWPGHDQDALEDLYFVLSADVVRLDDAANKLFHLVDVDNSGGIDQSEFRQLYRSLLTLVSENGLVDLALDCETSQDMIASAFSSMDVDGDGVICIDELKSWLWQQKESTGWQELQVLLSDWC